ncbi:hypothetical protein Gohar_009773 [Gossypium harknessii]|uniref:Uncharacterized protein n=1 Tax=Gossypium harknessii TaxID=34285 RepID=A0A7J9GR33_9ROSI|nr:hypothetical protein [Gossypium harknessii]
MDLRSFFYPIITMCKAPIPSKGSVRYTVSRAIPSLTPSETTTSSVVLNIILPPVLSIPIALPFTANARCHIIRTT